MISIDPNESWAVTEFADAQLNDERRTKRLVEIATLLAQQPKASFPEACSDKAMLKATYRFFDNAAIDPKEIFDSHVTATSDRITDCPLILAVQDTTDLNFTHHPKTVDLGPVSGKNQQGLLAHTTVAMTPERVPLGLLAQQVWARDKNDVGKSARRKTRPIDQKESHKWLTSLQAVIEVSGAHPNTHFVSVGDTEADVYDLFIEKRPKNVDLLVRAAWNRRVSHPEQYLWSKVCVQPIAGAIIVDIPRRGKQPARQARLEVRFTSVWLCPPRYRKAEKLPRQKVWAVLATEPNPPEGIAPIEWLLLTTCPVATIEQAIERIDWYACRWGIEVLHKVLKSGCRIESRQLGTASRLLRCLSVFSVVAWRILYATMLSRALPNAPCEAILAPEEWQALYCRIHQTATLPPEMPTLRQAVDWIARLGGFLGRRSDGDPGVTVLWKGFQHLTHLTAMYCILRSPPD